MSKKNRPAWSARAGGETWGKVNQNCPHVTTSPGFSQHYTKPHFNRALSDLLDQALTRHERHQRLAQYHAGEAEKHRLILASLQRRIPRPAAGGEL